MLADWLRSGKSKHAYIVAKRGYYGGGSVRKTRDWPRRLIEAIRTEGTNDEDLLRTFVAHFGPAYGGNVSVDALYMSVPDLVPAERSLDPNAPRVPNSVPTPQLPKAKPTPKTRTPGAEASGWANDGPSLPSAIGTPVAPGDVQQSNNDLNFEQEPTSQPPLPTPGVNEAQPPVPANVVALGNNKALAAWDQVQTCKSDQALLDWRTAERVRNHVNMLTHQHVREVPHLYPDGSPRLDAAGRPKVKLESTLTPMQVRQLAEAVAAVQRTQRLALGMSTDNIGLDLPPSAGSGTHVAQPSPEDEAPLFIVEMTQNGKFVRQRPTRIR